MEDKDYKTIIESILFTMGESVALTKIAAAIELEQGETKRLIDELAREYIEENRGMRIMELEEAYQMCTSQNTYEYLIKIAKQPKKHVLTEVLLETLSIIAYKQPVTKAEIEKIRGVSFLFFLFFAMFSIITEIIFPLKNYIFLSFSGNFIWDEFAF